MLLYSGLPKKRLNSTLPCPHPPDLVAGKDGINNYLALTLRSMFFATFAILISSKMTNRTLEKYYPIALTLLSVPVIYLIMCKVPFAQVVRDEILKFEFLSLVITIEVTLFGFLLAVLAIVLQMGNRAIEIIKKHNRFNELINYNKMSVLSCIWVVVFTSTLILLNKYLGDGVPAKIIFTIWISSIFYNALSTYRFVTIFYKLSKLD